VKCSDGDVRSSEVCDEVLVCYVEGAGYVGGEVDGSGRLNVYG